MLRFSKFLNLTIRTVGVDIILINELFYICSHEDKIRSTKSKFCENHKSVHQIRGFRGLKMSYFSNEKDIRKLITEIIFYFKKFKRKLGTN